MARRLVDVAINVFGKPAQTALSLISLMRHSGHLIDRIFFVEERTPINEHYDHEPLLNALERVTRFRPAHTIWRFPLDPSRLSDPAYRHSLRYQYAFEHTDKSFLFLLHNDCEFVGDVIGHLLANLGSHAGVGTIGQCGLCPAAKLGKCGPGRYREYRPDFAGLEAIYRELDPSIYRRKYLVAPTQELRDNPWPLPECRLNEYSCLINMRIARPLTAPLGPARPFGAYVDVGDPETADGILDIGVAWFGDLVRMGQGFGHVDLSRHVLHSGGHTALFDYDEYIQRENRALAIIAEKYGGGEEA